MINVQDARQRARRRLPRMIFDFVDGGAGDEVTLRRNQEAFQELELLPQNIGDVTGRSQAVTVLGQTIDTPILLAPTGMVRLVHRGSEVAASRAAAAAGTITVLSTMSSDPVEAVSAACQQRLWFQIFTCRDRWVTEALIGRARSAHAQALCITIDTPVAGRRERDLRNGMTLPPKLGPRTVLDLSRHPLWLADMARRPEIPYGNFIGLGEDVPDGAFAMGKFALGQLVHAGKDWDEIAWVRSVWPGPLLIKGVMTAEMARRAVDVGADGVLVSNHGGRQLDGLPGTIDALPEIVAAVGHQVDVLLDGGVRRGTDVIKARALGAKACLIGRPYLYGLAIGGQAGVAAVLAQFRLEIDAALALLGCCSLDEVDGRHVRIRRATAN